MENSSPEGDSASTARPSFDLMTVSLPGPSSASQEDQSGHCACVSVLKKGCRSKIRKHRRENHCQTGSEALIVGWKNTQQHLPAVSRDELLWQIRSTGIFIPELQCSHEKIL